MYYSDSMKNTAPSRQEANHQLDDHAVASAMRHSGMDQEGAYDGERHFEQLALIRNMLQHRERKSAAAQGATSSAQKPSLLASAAAYLGDGRGQFSNKDDYDNVCSKLLMTLKSPSMPSETEKNDVDDYRNQEQPAPPLTAYFRGSSSNSNRNHCNTNEGIMHAAKIAAMSGVVMATTEVDAEDTYARKVTNESRQKQEAPKKKKPASRKRKATTFAQKLMALLSEEKCNEVIHWMPDGDSFCIADRATFMSELLPKYFNKESKLESFARRLKRWGFQRINNSGTKANAVSVYSCKMFRRDKPELCAHMCDDRQLKKVKKEPSPSINYHRQQPCWGGYNQAQFSMQRPQDNMPINASLVVEDDSCPPLPASVPYFAAERKHSMGGTGYCVVRGDDSHHNLDVTAPGVAMCMPYQRQNSAISIINTAAHAASSTEKMQSKWLPAADDTSSSSASTHFRQESPSHHFREDSMNNQAYTASASTATVPGSPKLVLLPNEHQGSTTASYGGNYPDSIRTEAKQRMQAIDEDLVSCQKRLLLLSKMKELREKRRRLMEFV